MPARDLERLPSWIEVPVGSRLQLRGQVSHAVRAAALVTAAGDTLPLSVDSLTVRGSLDVDSAQNFVVLLTDHHGLQTLHNA